MEKADNQLETRFISSVQPDESHCANLKNLSDENKRYLLRGWGEDKPLHFSVPGKYWLNKCLGQIQKDIKFLSLDILVQQHSLRSLLATNPMNLLLFLRSRWNPKCLVPNVVLKAYRYFIRQFSRVIQGSGKKYLFHPSHKRIGHTVGLKTFDKPEFMNLASGQSTATINSLLNSMLEAGFYCALGVGSKEDIRSFRRTGFGLVDMECVLSGPGRPKVINSEGLGLYRYSHNSLFGWLENNIDDGLFRKIGVIALGNDVDDDSLGMLRGRLFKHQKIVISTGSKLAGRLDSDWHSSMLTDDDYTIYYNPPTTWLSTEEWSGSDINEIDWPRISVVTVSFNQAEYLAACLDSVIGQSYPNLEYIVVDACSTDGSIEILESYRSKITKLLIEPDKGQSNGLNKGFRLATGEILTWVNSDDLIQPNALFNVARAFLKNKIDLVVGGCNRIDGEGGLIHRHHCVIPIGTVTELSFPDLLRWKDSWSKGNYFFQPEVFFSREIWEKSGAFLKEHLYWAMDYDLWLRMAMAQARILHIPDVLAVSRVHAEQKTTSDRPYLGQLRTLFYEYHHLLSCFSDEPKIVAPIQQ